MIDRKKPFLGIEAEGPRRGKRTLFVPGSTPPTTLAEVCTRLGNERPDYVYYGAGDDREFRQDTFVFIADVWVHRAVTVEVNSISERIKVLHYWYPNMIWISLNKEDLSYHGCWYKEIKEGEIIWTNHRGTRIVTKMSDPLFSLDREI